MKELISLLGFQTESISPHFLRHNVSLACMSFKEQFRLMISKTWWVFLTTVIIAFCLPLLSNYVFAEKPYFSLSGAIFVGGICFGAFMFLFGIGLGKLFMPNKTSLLSEISNAYMAFIRDLIAMGAYEIARHENDFLPLVEKFLKEDEASRAFVKKAEEVRSIPKIPVTHFSGKNYEDYRKYNDLYEGFQRLSSFIPNVAA